MCVVKKNLKTSFEFDELYTLSKNIPKKFSMHIFLKYRSLKKILIDKY